MHLYVIRIINDNKEQKRIEYPITKERDKMKPCLDYFKARPSAIEKCDWYVLTEIENGVSTDIIKCKGLK